MSKNETKQKVVLTRLEKYFTEKQIAAKIIDEGQRLTVLLTELAEGTEIYGDIWFPPVAEENGDFSLLALEFEVEDTSDLDDAQAMDLMVGSAIMNGAVPMGGFGVTTNEDGDRLTCLTFRHMLPLIPAFSEDQIYATAEKTFFAMATVMKDAIPDLLALARGELSKEEFLQRL